MNECKEDGKFVYPYSFSKLLGHLRTYFHLPYRKTADPVTPHAPNTVSSITDYSNRMGRINRLNIKISQDFNIHDNDFVIAIDCTGMKVSNRGEWIRYKLNVKRGCLEIHLAVDIKKKRILSLKIISEQVDHGKVFPELADDITIKQNKELETTIMDGSFISNRNFQFYHLGKLSLQLW
jgi:hypothetical protein